MHSSLLHLNPSFWHLQTFAVYFTVSSIRRTQRCSDFSTSFGVQNLIQIPEREIFWLEKYITLSKIGLGQNSKELVWTGSYISPQGDERLDFQSCGEVRGAAKDFYHLTLDLFSPIDQLIRHSKVFGKHSLVSRSSLEIIAGIFARSEGNSGNGLSCVLVFWFGTSKVFVFW